MALYKEFQYGDGVLYGAYSPALVFRADVNIQEGGARHGSTNIYWDISALVEAEGTTAMMVVARPLAPATVPEEGEVAYITWEPGAHLIESASYYTQVGTWTYFSLFVMGGDRRWRWVAYRLTMPVSDWDYSAILPSLLPGAMTTDDQVVASPPTVGNTLSELLGEFGFVFDEVKSYAEALVPFWSPDNIVPQAAPFLAALKGTTYYPQLGPEAYRNLLKVKSEDATIDVMGLKTSAITRWHNRVRMSVNEMVNINDSSAENRAGLWAATTQSTVTDRERTTDVVTLTTDAAHGLSTGDPILVYNVGDTFDGRWTVLTAPTATTLTYTGPGDDLASEAASGTVTEMGAVRREHTGDPEEILVTHDVGSTAYHRFSGGTWICGDPNDDRNHNINTNFWATAVAGFLLRVNSGTDVDVTLSINTRATLGDPSDTNVPLLALEGLTTVSDSDWTWYQSDVIAMNTDIIGRPQLEISPANAIVDIDVMVIGPAPRGYRAIPTLEAHIMKDSRYDEDNLLYDESMIYDRVNVGLGVIGPPEFSSAQIDWGDGTAKDIVDWDVFAVSLQTHDYRTRIQQGVEQRFFITVKDVNDPLIAASTSLIVGEIGR